MNSNNKQKYIDNNLKISELLTANERILREEGFAPPVNNYAVGQDQKIKLPAGYIRTTGDFIKLYSLDIIILDKHKRKNIAYALQLSDFYNFLVNRFNIWGSVETMLYKQAFVNVISIVEALILESSNSINNYCKKCKKIKRCEKNINKEARNNIKKATEKLFELNILNDSQLDLNRINELYDYRNKIHIRLNDQNEYLDDIYNRDLYNESINLLKTVNKCLVLNAVPYYDTCFGFAD